MVDGKYAGMASESRIGRIRRIPPAAHAGINLGCAGRMAVPPLAIVTELLSSLRVPNLVSPPIDVRVAARPPLQLGSLEIRSISIPSVPRTPVFIPVGVPVPFPVLVSVPVRFSVTTTTPITVPVPVSVPITVPLALAVPELPAAAALRRAVIGGVVSISLDIGPAAAQSGW